MTFRELLCDIIGRIQNVEDEVKVAILYRDAHGCVVARKIVPISKISFTDGTILVEASDLDSAKVEK